MGNLIDWAKSQLPSLSSEEQRLIDSLDAGLPANCLESDQPIRGSVLEAMISAPLVSDVISKEGISIRGGTISGNINLGRARISFPLNLKACHITGYIDFRGAVLKHMSLEGSKIRGVRFDGVSVAGNLCLRKALIEEEADFDWARILGDLDFTGVRIQGVQGTALHARSASVGGDVLLGKSEVNGRVDLQRIRIGGSLRCSDARFKNPMEIALYADDAAIEGDVLLDGDFIAQGEVRLVASKIGRGLKCSDGQFLNPGRDALCANNALIGGKIATAGRFLAEGEVRLPFVGLSCENSGLYGNCHPGSGER